MGYSKEIYEAANAQLEQRHRLAVSEAEQRKNALYARYPRAAQIQTLLSSTAIQAAKAVLDGSNTVEQLTKLKQSNLALQKELAEILRAAGAEPDYLEVRYQCSQCMDTGYIDGKICSCMKLLLRSEAYRRLNSLSPLSLSTFDSFSTEYYSAAPLRDGFPSPRKRMEDILRYCKNYAADFSISSPSILMQGATGLGKTHLSLAIAHTAIHKGYGVIYGSAQNMISKLEKERFNYNRDGQTDESEAHLIDCDLLILDDLGTEFSTSFSNATIYNIINSRIMSGKPTIISTNLSMKELERCYSERLVSRIMGNHVRLEFFGSDVRQQKRIAAR